MRSLAERKSILEDLLKLRVILKDEKSWSQRAFTRDKNGVPVMFRSGKSCKYCLDAGILKVSIDESGKRDVLKEIRLSHFIKWRLPRPYTSICHFNDDKTTCFLMVSLFIDRCISELTQSLEEI